MKMSFNEFMRRNKPITNVLDTICETYGIPQDRLETFAAIMYESGQFDSRIDQLEKWLDSHPEPPADEGTTQESDAAAEGSS